MCWLVEICALVNSGLHDLGYGMWDVGWLIMRSEEPDARGEQNRRQSHEHGIGERGRAERCYSGAKTGIVANPSNRGAKEVP